VSWRGPGEWLVDQNRIAATLDWRTRVITEAGDCGATIIRMEGMDGMAESAVWCGTDKGGYEEMMNTR
jgi:hypothetical protein